MRSLRLFRCTAAILSTALVLTMATASFAAVQVPVKATSAFEETPGVGAGTYLAWSRGNSVTLFLQSDIGQPAFRVNNPHNARAWAGSIDGTTLVYQRAARDGNSDIRFLDVVSHVASAPTGVNTPNWEWHPTTSGDWILFGREVFRGSRSRVFLHNTSTGETIPLADVRGVLDEAHPGQVSGNWAVWDQCVNQVCDVYRYDLTAHTKMKVPNTLVGREQYFPSVTSAGTVYFVHSGNACGRNVKLVEWVAGQPLNVLASFGQGKDVTSTTQTVPDQAAGTDVYYDKLTCSTGDSDIFKIVVP
jgi:hypothetical protein